MTNTTQTTKSNMSLTETQKKWLADNKLEVLSRSNLTIGIINGSWVYGTYQVEEQTDSYNVVYLGAKTTAGFTSPVGKVLSKHKTLNAALKELVGLTKK